MAALLIGLSGLKGCGKDTVCKLLAKNYSIRRIAFADPLKEELAQACGVTTDFIGKNKDAFRPGLQWWATEFRRNFFSKDYWISRAAARLEAARATPGIDAVIVTDVRFPNEASWIWREGGVIWRIERPIPWCFWRKWLRTRKDSHASEALGFGYDTLVKNDGSLGQLERKARAAFEELVQSVCTHITG